MASLVLLSAEIMIIVRRKQDKSDSRNYVYTMYDNVRVYKYTVVTFSKKCSVRVFITSFIFYKL